MSWQDVAGTGIGLKEKVFRKQASDDRQPDLLFVVVWMAFPDSFCQKDMAGLGQESSRLETLFRLHALKDFDLDLFSVGARVERSHLLTIPFRFDGHTARENFGAHGRI